MAKPSAVNPPIDRRTFLLSGAALAACARLPTRPAAQAVRGFSLEAAAATLPIVGGEHPATPVWCFDGRVPGPEIRARQGERVRIAVANRLEETTTVHWHGVRVPNAMDGVPHLTQAPIAARGGTFTYEFELPDAGTFWYHPHSRSYEQVDRGLYGAFVVEERAPPAVDRDVTWVLDDWRLARDASVTADFLAPFDTTHGGRIGNTVTVNGAIAERFALRAGERLRLRLVNAANARIFGLRFAGHAPWIVAYDGQPVRPHEPAGGVVVVGPSQRVDLVLDAIGRPGSRHRVADVYYRRQAYRLLDLDYADAAPLRPEPPGPVPHLPGNPLAEPDLARAERHVIELTGGAMGGRAPREVRRDGSGEAEHPLPGAAWAMNGVAIVGGHVHEPLLALRRGTSVVLDFVNDTAWPHPMHLHGHAFRVLARNGAPTAHREWRDTVLLEARETARVAFVADNPGDWMLHCHILEHQAAGMMATLRVE